MSLTPSVDEARPEVLPRVKPKSAKSWREQKPPSSPPEATPRRPNTCEGTTRNNPSELSLWRDSQTVQAYLGPISKLPSPTSWASRTAASCAFSNTKPSSDSSEIMELKRQLAHTTQDLHLTKISRSLSTGNGSAAVMAMISPSSGEVPGAPGSPYRASSGTALNTSCGPKPSLSKELMQKLRSMTETIKMLSDENAQLRTQNEEILRAKKEEKSRNNRRASNGLYDDLDKQQLVELVLSYDEKLKALSSEVSDLQKKLKATDEASKECEVALNQTSKGSAEKDKYKQLARRLKEERNNFRDSLEAKQKEQSDLKEEMEKMSDLISELRVNCQTLQSELSEVRAVSRDRSDAAVQANILISDNSRPTTTTRKSSGSSITQESIRKARSVYGAKQPKLRVPNNNHSLTSLNNKEVECNKVNKNFHRSTSMSPSKAATNNGARIAKPVSRTQQPSNNNRIMSTSYTITKNKDYNSSSGCSPSAGSSASSTKLPMSPHGSQVSSTLSTSARTTPSRIPQPESSSPRKSRIPSAPRYYTPNRNHCKSPSVGSPVSVASPKVATPPPRKTSDRHANNSPLAKASVSPLRDTNKVEKDHKIQVQEQLPPPQPQFPSPSRPTSEAGSSIRTASPPPPPPPTGMTGMEVDDIIEPSPLPPPPGPPVSRVNHRSDSEDDEEEEEDEEILRVTSENGNVELAMSSKAESPIVPSVIGKYSPSNSAGSSEENPSADDEGSHGDGDEKATTPEASSSNSVDCTPRTKKKVEHFRQGLAARRIQRTWKHFYEELEERKDVRNELPAPLVQVIEDKAKLEAADNISSPSLSKAKSSPEHDPAKPKEDVNNEIIDKEKALNTIEEAFVDHQRRERALAGLKAKIHTARPWQKKKNSSQMDHAETNEESSEEELERAYRALHLRGNDIRAKVSVIKADQDLFTSGKVSEMKARLNERRQNMSKLSDGITEDDDDEDVVY